MSRLSGPALSAWPERRNQGLEALGPLASSSSSSSPSSSSFSSSFYSSLKMTAEITGKDKYWEEMNNAEQAAAVLFGWESVSEPATSV